MTTEKVEHYISTSVTDEMPLVTDMQFGERFTSNALNRQWKNIKSVGIYAGFNPVVKDGDVVEVGDESGKNTLVAEADGFPLTVHLQKPISLSIPRAKSMTAVVEAYYQFGVKTKQVDGNSEIEPATLKLIESADVKEHHIKIFSVYYPGDAPKLLQEHLDLGVRVDASISGAYSQEEASNIFLKKIAVVTETELASRAEIENKYIDLVKLLKAWGLWSTNDFNGASEVLHFTQKGANELKKYIDQRYDTVMGGLSPERLDSIADLAREVEENETALATILNKLATKADINHVHDDRYARIYQESAVVNNDWVKFATVIGGGPAGGYGAQCELSFTGTAINCVLSGSALINVSHNRHISIALRNGGYSVLSLKVFSDGNNNFDIYARSSVAVDTPVKFTIRTLNLESFTFDSTVNYSTTSLGVTGRHNGEVSRSIGNSGAPASIDYVKVFQNGKQVFSPDNLNISQNINGSSSSTYVSEAALREVYRRATQGIDYTGRDILIGGDANTYYPVLLHGFNHGGYSYEKIQISRGFNWEAPDTWNTATHRGGLTLCIDWSGDGSWGGNDQNIRVSEFHQNYTGMVSGLQLSTSGIVVWLRGGGAKYRLNGPRGVQQPYSVFHDVFTDSKGTQFKPMSYDPDRVKAELSDRYCLRSSGHVYDRGERVYSKNNPPVNGEWLAFAAKICPVGVPMPWLTDVAPEGFAIMKNQAFDKAANPILASIFPSGILPDPRGRGFIGKEDNETVGAFEEGQVKEHGHPNSSAVSTNLGSKNTNTTGNHTHSLKGAHNFGSGSRVQETTTSSGRNFGGTNAAGNHYHSVSIGSHSHEVLVALFGAAKNTIDHIKCNWIIRMA